MKKIKKIILTFLLMLCFGVAVSKAGINDAIPIIQLNSSYPIGQRVYQTAAQYHSDPAYNRVICVEHDKDVDNSQTPMYYRVIDYTKIIGNKLYKSDGTIQINEIYARVSYWANKKVNGQYIYDLRGTGRPPYYDTLFPKNYSLLQNVLFKTNTFGSINHYLGIPNVSGFATITSNHIYVNDSDIDGIITEGNNKANQLWRTDWNGNKTITQNSTNIKTNVAKYPDGQNYIEIGPFNWSFEGTIRNLDIKDLNGNSISQYRIITGYNTDKNNQQMSGYNDPTGITSGKDFYISINTSLNVGGISKINATGNYGTSVTLDQVEIWYLQEETHNWQNMIYFVPLGETTTGGNISGEFNYNLVFNGNIEIIKIDETTKDPIQNVGFQVYNVSLGQYITGTNPVTFGSTARTFYTDVNGKIFISTVPIGTYRITETTIGDNYGYTVDSTPHTVNVLAGQTASLTVTNKYGLGNLKIIKQDETTKEPLQGVGFKIKNVSTGQYVTGTDPVTYGNESQAKVYYTDAEGSIEISRLWEGNYQAIETTIGDNYGYIVDSTPNPFNIVSRQTTTITVYNKYHMGELKIIKIDQDNQLPLEGVGFKIKNTSNDQYITAIDPITYGTESQARIFYTDANGEIKIDRIWEGNYQAIEVSVGDNEAYEVVSTPQAFTIVAENTTEKTITNRKKYVNLTGYVWEDIQSEKMSVRNDLYNDSSSDDADIRVDGITVKILDQNGNVVKNPVTGQDQVTVTANGGIYQFKKLVIDDLSKYTVQFTYDGLIYENVVAHLSKANGSKAVEPGRQEFNNKFNSVEKGQQENQAAIKNQNDSTVASVDYTFRQYDSGRVAEISETRNCEITADTKSANYTLSYDRKQESIVLENVNLGIYKRRQADLAVQKELDQVKVEIGGYGHVYKYGTMYDETNAQEVQNSWNIGVRFESRYKGTYTRPVYRADAEYETGDGSNELEMKVTYKITIANQEALPTRINQIVDYCDSRFDNIVIGTGIDASNGNLTGTFSSSSYRIQNNSDYKRVEIDVNQTINPSAVGATADKATQISLYVQYDLSREAIVSLLNEGVSEDDVNLNEKLQELERRRRNLTNIAEVSSFTTFSPNNPSLLYAAVDKDSIPENATPFDETTYEDDTDKSSSLAIVIANARTVSGLVFEDSENGQLRETENVVEGDSRYDEATEDTIGGVKVELIDATTGNVVQIYDEIAGEWTDARAETVTGSDGTYSISGFIPGKYKIKFTYGDGSYKILDTGNTQNYTNMTESYKSTVINYDKYREISQNKKFYRDANTHMSYAIDNIQTRQEIDENFKIYNFKSTNDIREMEATTPEFEINVEYEDDDLLTIDIDYIQNRVKFNVNNIDLGIIRRPRQEISIEKSISEIRLALSNGQALIDAQIDEDGNVTGQTTYLSYIKPVKVDGKVTETGFVRIELDSSLMQGSTVSLKYRFTLNNQGEADYINIDNSNEMFNYGYYKYGESYYTSGIVSESQKQNDVITISPTMIIDYLNEGVGYQPDDPTNIEYLWQAKSISELESSQLVQSDVIQALKTGTYNQYNEAGEIVSSETIDENQIFTTDYFKVNNIKFKPKYAIGGTIYEAETGAVYMVVSQLLSSDNDVTFQNQAEIVEITKDGGGRTVNFVPGNYVPNKVNKEVDDTTSQELIVVPSTGSNKAYILPIMVLVISFVILGIGIYLIIVKVMKKEYR